MDLTDSPLYPTTRNNNNNLSVTKPDIIIMKSKGSQKNKGDWTKKFSQFFIVFILAACVLGFTLNMAFFTGIKSAQPGSLVTIDYTIYTPDDIPVLTSDQNILQAAYQKGIPVVLTRPMSIEVGSQQENSITDIEGYDYQGGTVHFALFSSELDRISDSLNGVRNNDIISVEFTDNLVMTRSIEDFEKSGFNVTAIPVGSLISLGFTETTYIPVGNITPVIPIRWVKVIDKTDDNITVRYNYGSADITVREIH